MNLPVPVPSSHRRRGSTLPALALAILVTGGCMALVLNVVWLSTNQDELQTAATAAALAAARELVGDDMLIPDSDPKSRAQAARDAAKSLVSAWPGPGPVPASYRFPAFDVHLGRVVIDPLTGYRETLETDYAPTSALVLARRDRARGNPLALLAPYLTGRSTADVHATSEASVSNLISGVRPIPPAEVPAWPLGILDASPDPRIPTWTRQIEERQGADDYRWDAESQRVVPGADGLTELTLKLISQTGDANLVVLDVGSGLRADALEHQFQQGWDAADLEPFGGQFPPPGELPPLDCSSDLDETNELILQGQIGQARVVILYEPLSEEGSAESVRMTRLAVARLLKVTATKDGPELLIQAAVLATRMAVLDEQALYQPDAVGNPYLYKLSLTQ